jgi:hypothetical protein
MEALSMHTVLLMRMQRDHGRNLRRPGPLEGVGPLFSCLPLPRREGRQTLDRLVPIFLGHLSDLHKLGLI